MKRNNYPRINLKDVNNGRGKRGFLSYQNYYKYASCFNLYDCAFKKVLLVLSKGTFILYTLAHFISKN